LSKLQIVRPNSLEIFSKASVMLAEADTILKAKDLKNLALTAADWAKRKGMGEEAILYCSGYALEAERKMGQMLRETQRAKGGNPKLLTGTSRLPVEPTLSEIGITKNESAKAQELAALPRDTFDQVKAGKKTRSKAKREIKAETDRKVMAKAATQITVEKAKAIERVCDVRVCSCAALFASGIRPDAIITDPPYPEEYLPVFSELSKAAKNVPLVAVMVGQSYLPEVLRRLTEYLYYRWTLAYLTPGGQSVQQWSAKINCFWKPVLLFGKAAAWVGDVARSDVNDNDKTHHHWGQSESGMADLIERLTLPGQLVCDPFVGGGSTAVAALALNRRFVGCDIDSKAVDETLLRVKAGI